MAFEKYTILETEHWRVALNKDDQRYLGRSVVVLKRKCGDLAEVTEEEFLDFRAIVGRLESLFRKTFGATMFNWACLMNLAYREVPPNPQVHWHFRPRYNHPVEIAGEKFEDPNFGSHYLCDEKDFLAVSAPRLEEIHSKLKKNL